MRKNAFTLIELLAVIVILAIIAVIAVPIVVNIINDSKDSSGKNAIELYIDAVEKAIVKKNYKTEYNPDKCIIQETGKLKCYLNEKEYSEELEIEMKGMKPTNGTIKIEKGKITRIKYLVIGDNYYRYNEGKTIKTAEPPKEAGLYDENYNLLASWDELVNTYHFEIEGYYANGKYNDGTSGSMYNVLNNNENLKNGSILIVKDGVSAIGDFALAKCTSIKTIVLPDTVIFVYSYAFWGCNNLEDINLPNSISIIFSDAFSQCSSLESIVIPNSVTSISQYTFAGCSNLKNVIIPNTVTTIGQHAFISCTNLKNIIIPNTVITIGQYAFHKSGLISLIIPNSVTSIGMGAFSFCSNLENITLSNNLESIPSDIFARCTSLTNITIPSTVTSIGQYAFSDCTNLKSIKFENTTGWYITNSSSATEGTDIDVSNNNINSTNLVTTYKNYYWKRN